MAREKKVKKVAPKLEDYVLPSDPASRKAISDAVNEVVDALVQKHAQSELIEAIAVRMFDELEVPKKFIKQLAAHQYKSNLKEKEGQLDVLSSSADVLASYGLKTGV